MAPIKLDEQLKEQLEQRRLQPSSQSWSQLANRLEDKDNSKNKRAFWWLGIAASIIVIIAVSLPFLNSDSDKAQPITVDTETETKKNIPAEVLETQNQEDIVEHKTLEIKKTENNIEAKIVQNQKEAIIRTIKTEKAVVKHIEKATNKLKTEETPINALNTFEAIKIKDVVAEIQKMKDAPSGVTDKEIDSLLKVAHKEILTQRIYNETSKTVDAELLLQDVEADLEQSFRSKVFDALKTNYGKVKTAVAERNN